MPWTLLRPAANTNSGIKAQGLPGRQGTMTVAQATSYKDCVLGQWLYSSGLEGFGDMPEMQQLVNLHQRFHEAAREVISSKASGDTDRSEKGSGVEFLSDQVVSLLTFLEQQTSDHGAANIVVLQADDRQFGLVVDEINDTEEIVVKPLGKQLKGISTFAGATIMGDGRVALILDVLGLAQRANVVSEVRDRAWGKRHADGTHHDDSESLLLLRGPDDGRMAMPLSLVAGWKSSAAAAWKRRKGVTWSNTVAKSCLSSTSLLRFPIVASNPAVCSLLSRERKAKRSRLWSTPTRVEV